MAIADILSDFELLEDWEDRYRYVIELGRGLPPLEEALRTEATRVRGCASQVWLVSTARPSGSDGDPILEFRGDSDAMIVKGLIAILLELLGGRRASEILSADALATFRRLGLDEHLTPQRSNGLRSMIERIRADARAALVEA